MDEAAEAVDAFDAHHAVGIDGDDRAHLLQQRDEIHDLRLDGRSPQFGHAFGAHCGQQHLLGGSDGGVGQFDLCSLQAAVCLEHDAAGGLVDLGSELAEHIEVEVDGAVADMAAAEVGDEGLTEAVQQRAAEEDRDAGRSGMGVDVDDGSRSHIGRVEVEFAVGLISVGAGGDADSVEFEETGDDLDVADLRHAAQHGRGLTEQRCHHRLGHQILGAADSDGAVQRISPTYFEHVPP